MKRLITLAICMLICASAFCVERLDTSTEPMYFGWGTSKLSVMSSRYFDDYHPFLTDDESTIYVMGINITYYGNKELSPLIFNTVGFTFNEYGKFACIHYHTNFDQDYMQVQYCYEDYLKSNYLMYLGKKLEETEDEYVIIHEYYDTDGSRVVFYIGRDKKNKLKGSMNIYIINNG